MIKKFISFFTIFIILFNTNIVNAKSALDETKASKIVVYENKISQEEIDSQFSEQVQGCMI